MRTNFKKSCPRTPPRSLRRRSSTGTTIAMGIAVPKILQALFGQKEIDWDGVARAGILLGAGAAWDNLIAPTCTPCDLALQASAQSAGLLAK